MLKRLFLHFIGGAKIRVGADHISGATRVLFELGLPSVFGARGWRGRTVYLRLCDLDVFSDACGREGVEFTVIKRFGAPEFLRKYGRRWGLIAGAVLLIAAIFIADDFVWRIDVVGNERIPDSAVTDQLDALGFRLGTRYKSVDFDKLHNRFLLASPDIAWIAVNMKGSVARVEVREYMAGGGDEPQDAANIVADCDGVITQVSAICGSPQVKIGDEVKKGQLLISGMVEYDGAGGKIVRARGEVFAEIERTIAVSVPLVSTETVKTGVAGTDFGIKIFSKTIFFGARGRIDTSSCDTITAEHDVTLAGTVILPIKLIERRYETSETRTVTRTREEAAAEAYRLFKLEFIEACRDASLLSYEMTDGVSEDGGAYEIVCRVKVIDDIAKTVPFEVGE